MVPVAAVVMSPGILPGRLKVAPYEVRGRFAKKGHSPEGTAGAPESANGQRGASPLQANVLRPETEGNRVAVRRGGKQLEVKDSSVG